MRRQPKAHRIPAVALLKVTKRTPQSLTLVSQNHYHTRIETAEELVYMEFNNKYKKDVPDTELDGGMLTTTVDLVCTTTVLY